MNTTPIHKVQRASIFFAIASLLVSLSAFTQALPARDEHQAAALGEFVYNYERRANRGLVRSAVNLAQQLPTDSHPQEVLDLVAAAAADSGISDYRCIYG